MISSYSTQEIIKDYFKGSGQIIIYRYDQRLLKKFIRDLQEMGYEINFNTNFKDIICIDKSGIFNFKDVEKLMKRNRFEYIVE